MSTAKSRKAKTLGLWEATVLRHLENMKKQAGRVGVDDLMEPFTGSRFTPYDQLRPIARRIARGLEARARIAPDLPPGLALPMGYAAREAAKARGGIHRILGWFARSLEQSGYDAAHPRFPEYAAHLLQDAHLRSYLGSPAELAEMDRKYTPRPHPFLNWPGAAERVDLRDVGRARRGE